MAANASPSGGAAAPVADAPKSSFSFPEVSMPSFPDASASSPSQALVKAGDVLSSTVTAISSKAGEALGVLGTNYPQVLLTLTLSARVAEMELGNCLLMVLRRHCRCPPRLLGLCIHRAIPQPEDQGVLP